MFKITIIEKDKNKFYFLIKDEETLFSEQHKIKSENMNLRDNGVIEYKLFYNSHVLIIPFNPDNPMYSILLKVRRKGNNYISSLESLFSKA